MADDANTSNDPSVEEHEDLFGSPAEEHTDPNPTAAEDGKQPQSDADGEDPKPEDGDDPAGKKPEGEEIEDPKTDPDKADPADPEKPADPKPAEDPQEKARREFAERQARKVIDDEVAAVRQAERQKQAELDPDDPNYRIDKLESDNRIRDAETTAAEIGRNLSNLANDEQVVAQTIPMFRQVNEDGTKNPDFNEAAFKAAELDFAQRYATFSEAEKPEDRVFLGAYDPKTGKPVSYANFMKQKASEYSTITSSSAAKAAEDARIAERKMRSNSDPAGGSGAPRKESAEDREAKDMAAAFAK